MQTPVSPNTADQLLAKLKDIVGNRHVITNPRSMERFCKGFRSGEGTALAVVQPGTLLEQWQVLKACVEADKIVIMQAANTGLTEGSTPNGDYDRDAVVLSTKRMDKIQVLKDGRQIISFPGATLFSLEKLMAPYDREPHSVIGSSCIGASIIGGVCNNSGGSLVERGPSYTELSLYAQIREDGQLELVNHLGISLGQDPETILTRLENGDYSDQDVDDTNLKASDTDYHRRVREIDEPSPARFNADKRRLHEASGCAGKLAVFAARLDTYPKPDTEKVFYIGTNDTQVLTRLRRHILAEFEHLPVSGEYMHAEIYDISKRYGKDTLILIDKLGTDWLPGIFALKGWADARLSKIPLLPANLTDRFMQVLTKLWPNILPKRMEDFRAHYEHHLILKMRDGGVQEAEDFLSKFFGQEKGDWFICSPREGKIAGLHRFAAAGAAVRYQAVHSNEVEDILALDIALRRDDRDWFEQLPTEIEGGLVHKLYYGHFFCHVLHQDYIVKKGQDPKALKEKMLKILDERGAEYPAEHNVGHLYKAKPDLAEFYKDCDPTNTLNPGIGKMSRRKCYH
ncbi:D-lactate dehydrogenase [Labrenzia sp. PHM005]|uniref:D-lactate dehydrogenase n=1 Tax=Labrenzia sp. PHM005 TaxID=2590016 RepID=UPI00113FF515|nr:D-lactate dehydrogenase [Labrenzia sp. PHM005]QDG76205.1 D-lactate dehydrogenase [Labrenzia sp. PHM005]